MHRLDAGLAAPHAVAGVRSRERAVALGMLTLATAAALMLRLDHLGSHSLWLDEVLTAQSIRFSSLNEVLGWVRIWVDNTPLLYVLTWLLGPLGGTEVVVRLPLAIAGTLTVPAVYALGLAVSSRAAGLAGAVFFAVGPFAVYFGQEARTYALVMLFTTLQMLFAFRVAYGSGRYAWLGLAMFTGLALQASYFGLVTTAAAFLWVALTLWLDRSMPGLNAAARAKRAGLAVALALVAYLPILPAFLAFLGRRDLGFGGIQTSEPVTPEGLIGLLAAIDVRGVIAALVAVGLLVAAYRAIRGSDRGMLLVLMWIGLPLVGLVVLSQGHLDGIRSRYYAFLYPAVVLLAAVGLMAGAQAFGRIAWRLLAGPERLGPRRRGVRRALVALAAASTVGFLVLTDWYPAITRAYGTPKGEDNRGAVEAILAVSPPGSSVVALGQNRAWMLLTIGYYLWRERSPIPIFDATQPGDLGLTRFQGPGDLWGIALDDWNEVPVEPPPQGTSLRVHGLTLIRLPDDGSTQLARLDRLLDWAAVFDPDVADSRRLIALLDQPVSNGGNLLPAPSSGVPAGSETKGRWVLDPGSVVDPDGRGFVVNPTNGEANVTFSTEAGLIPGRYALTFSCSGAAGSTPTVYVSEGTVATLGSSQASVAVYPTGAGYHCSAGGRDRWIAGGFLFTLASPGITITIWLRNSGSDAAFRDVRLVAAP